MAGRFSQPSRMNPLAPYSSNPRPVLAFPNNLQQNPPAAQVYCYHLTADEQAPRVVTAKNGNLLNTLSDIAGGRCHTTKKICVLQCAPGVGIPGGATHEINPASIPSDQASKALVEFAKANPQSDLRHTNPKNSILNIETYMFGDLCCGFLSKIRLVFWERGRAGRTVGPWVSCGGPPCGHRGERMVGLGGGICTVIRCSRRYVRGLYFLQSESMVGPGDDAVSRCRRDNVWVRRERTWCRLSGVLPDGVGHMRCRMRGEGMGGKHKSPCVFACRFWSVFPILNLKRSRLIVNIPVPHLPNYWQ